MYSFKDVLQDLRDYHLCVRGGVVIHGTVYWDHQLFHEVNKFDLPLAYGDDWYYSDDECSISVKLDWKGGSVAYVFDGDTGLNDFLAWQDAHFGGGI